MEGSEDDAGAATNASRRESAREKGTEEAKNVDAAPDIHQETSEARSHTPAMSDDNFDGDSVPSPSSHDVNTSTDAILDMIDEFVDGPGAPKRVPSAPVEPPDPDPVDTARDSPAEPTDNLSVPESEQNKDSKPGPMEPPVAPPALPVPSVSPVPPDLCAKSEILLETEPNTQAESASNIVISEASVTPEALELPQTTSSVPEPEIEIVPSMQEAQLAPSLETEAPSSYPPTDAATSVSNAQDTSKIHEQERTVKCVTSSESNDNVTVESAESTSSDNVFSATATRSPLRRRLVRPARPDTTVSSTVDVHPIIVETCEPTPSDSVVKDVSSSSDAVVSSIQGPTTEDIRQASNLSEVSVCKAETSVSTPKKIKLIRNKITAPVSHSIQVTQEVKPQQCQSTSALPVTCSSDNVPASIPEPVRESSSSELNYISTSESTEKKIDKDVCKESTRNEPILQVVEAKKIDQEGKESTRKEPVLEVGQTQHNESDFIPFSKETPKPKEPTQVLKTPACATSSIEVGQDVGSDLLSEIEEQRVPPIKLNLSNSSEQTTAEIQSNVKCVKEQTESTVVTPECSETLKQVPKLTIKLTEEMKSPVPKLTIKPIPRPNVLSDIPNVTKLNIKPIPRPPEKINDVHRKSSSSEISESEYSENDDTSTSDQASASDQGPAEVVPKVTIKLGKRGTESEGKFYTEQKAPKLTIKSLQNEEHGEDESVSKIKLKISQSDDRTYEKIPKLTIKPVTKSDSQPPSPKLTIKPIKPPESISKDASVEHQEVLRIQISQESLSPREAKENSHVPKITIKPVTKQDTDINTKTLKKTAAKSDEPEHIPIVTKLNIKPIPKPTESSSGESSDRLEEKVPVVSKLNIKPIVKPKDNEVDSTIEDLPKVTKINIKPIKNPEQHFSESKDCDVWNTGSDEKIIPVVTKLNIKPIVKPSEPDTLKDSENQSSETGNSSDDNTDQIPVVTKLNIKPIVKPNDIDYANQKANSSNEDTIPVVTKLNIKPLIKPGESTPPMSPKKDFAKGGDIRNLEVPVVTKINIKPIVKPDEVDQKSKEFEETMKNPPLVMKINIKSMTESSTNDGKIDLKVNSIEEHKRSNHIDDIPVVTKINIKPIVKPSENEIVLKEPVKPVEKVRQTIEVNCHVNSTSIAEELKYASFNSEPNSMTSKHNCLPGNANESLAKLLNKPIESITTSISKEEVTAASKNCVRSDSSSSEGKNSDTSVEDYVSTTHKHDLKANDIPIDANKKQALEKLAQATLKPQQSCTLLKKLLEDTSKKVNEHNLNSNFVPIQKPDVPSENHTMLNSGKKSAELTSPITIDSDSPSVDNEVHGSSDERASDDCTHVLRANWSMPSKEKMNELVARPLEINTASDKITSSGQDSPRIILKINKTDHGASSEIITEDVRKPEVGQASPVPIEMKSVDKDQQHAKNIVNSRKKHASGEVTDVMMAKRLRSSRVVQETDKTPVTKRNVGKRAQADLSPDKSKESEMSVLESKRAKLNKLLLNKSLTITPVTVKANEPSLDVGLQAKQAAKTVNNSVLNNQNCPKNGNSKLHKILSSLQAKQMQALPRIDINCTEQSTPIIPERDSTNTSTGSSDVVEVIPIENSHEEMQEMLIIESSVSRDCSISNDDVARDPLEVDSSKVTTNNKDMVEVLLTPQPKKRGRPRKIPLSEGAKPVALPTPALEERPQRSLRLSRDRPVVVPKPRGRGRGRGAKRPPAPVIVVEKEPSVELANQYFVDERKAEEEIDPTSSRIKLPRLTEALDKMPSTPLSSRRRNSSGSGAEVKEEMPEPPKDEEIMKSPEYVKSGRGGRGRGGRGRTPGRSPRNRGRGRGGGRGATYMKETMGIYGRVCGPATTTVQLFEEETCMMDDNATPAKPAHLVDEDSQSSVKSSTNESSSKARKSKFADLFDSNKIWTAADVKEYKWPQDDTLEAEKQVMMIQEQVAMFLGVKSFKRRYPELKRRSVVGDERLFLLSTGCVNEALCDLGITAVDASEVLDIMLSDFPHKYEEYRAHLRQKQIEEQSQPPPTADPLADVKPELGASRGSASGELDVKVEMKPEPSKPEPPKVDPEKLRQETAAAAAASASEWNARLNAMRRPAAVDLQSMTIHRRRAPMPPPRIQVVPPAGLYPHALLPGQYQHWCRVYTPEELRYFPLNTALAAPPAPPSPAESETDSEPAYSSLSSSEDSDRERSSGAKRKKLTKVKRRSNTDAPEPADGATCRSCGLREEANRKYSHERFLHCAHCRANIHPSCLELGADTIRKCREYAWQCAECKSCCACHQPADDDKMLFCDLCDRGFHIYCVGLGKVPSGRWHCVECAVCKSCGARDAAGAGGAEAGPAGAAAAAPEWHHQSKRGPGGHKVYSHSLCTPCARKSKTGPRQNANTKATQLEEKSGAADKKAYRIGRYCPLCERSFIGPKGTMQLVICKLCDRQLHQDCVRQTVSNLNVLDYTCGECRRGGITSRAAAARLAPRTIATLFMAKRRFNKYAHKQYMQSRLPKPAKPSDEDSVEMVVPEACDDEPDTSEVSDPLDGTPALDEVTMAPDEVTITPVTEVETAEPDDEAAAAVKALQMDFGD